MGEEVVLLVGPPPAGDMILYAAGREMIRLTSNGDIYVKGRLVTNDVDVVDGMRELLRLAKIERQEKRELQ